MLRDVVRRCRRRAHAPVIHAASHFYHEKSVSWVSISMHACDPVPIVMELCLAALWAGEAPLYTNSKLFLRCNWFRIHACWLLFKEMSYILDKKIECTSLYSTAFLKSKIIPVPISRCPSRAISWLVLVSLFPFIWTQQNTTSSKDLCFFHLFVHLTQKHLTLSSSSLCCP